MIGRTSSRSKTLHLVDKERNKRSRILDQCFRLLIKIGFVGRSATFHHAKESIFVALCCLDVDLCRQVATRIHLVIHIERCVLRVSQILFRVGFVHSSRECFFVAEVCPDVLPLLTVYDCRARILTERELSLSSHLGIT